MNDAQRIKIAKNFISHHKQSIRDGMYAAYLKNSDYINIFLRLNQDGFGPVLRDVESQTCQVLIAAEYTGGVSYTYVWCDRINKRHCYPISASVLKKRAELRGSLYFDRYHMQATGETMSNYYVNSETVIYNGYQCFELLRRKPTKLGEFRPAYFECQTYALIIKDEAKS